MIIDKSAIKPKLVHIIAGTFGIAPETITEDFSDQTCEVWDSVRHLTLVLAIEEEFGITFDEDEIWNLASLAALTEAIEGRLPT